MLGSYTGHRRWHDCSIAVEVKVLRSVVFLRVVYAYLVARQLTEDLSQFALSPRVTLVRQAPGR